MNILLRIDMNNSLSYKCMIIEMSVLNAQAP